MKVTKKRIPIGQDETHYLSSILSSEPGEGAFSLHSPDLGKRIGDGECEETGGNVVRSERSLLGRETRPEA